MRLSHHAAGGLRFIRFYAYILNQEMVEYDLDFLSFRDPVGEPGRDQPSGSEGKYHDKEGY